MANNKIVTLDNLTTYNNKIQDKFTAITNSTSTSLAATASAVKEAYDLANGKQDELVSGTNIKTINGESILGSGNIECATKTYVDDLVGDINSVLENIINGGLITFTIDGVQYKASENMTWIDWVNSSHNVDNYIFHSGDTYYVIYSSTYSRYVQGVALDYTGTNGTIIANENYTTGVVDWPV